MNTNNVTDLFSGAIIGIGLGIAINVLIAKPETVTVEKIVEVPVQTLVVDGSECWFPNKPVLTYRVNEQAVDTMITCRTTIIDAHLPAIERTQ